MEEFPIFYGRAEHVESMVEKLEEHRFLAVLGSSGAGKSSLVRAGLIPALKEGFLDGEEEWQFVITHPGQSPIARLARALHQASDPEKPFDNTEIAFTESMLRRGASGFVEAMRDYSLTTRGRLLILVDQFEEIFRFQRHEHREPDLEARQRLGRQRDEARTFVHLLLSAVEEEDFPIYVIITMRSDFLGECDAFRGLPEAMNEAQFLTPRLTRDQLKQAIEGPLTLFNAEAEPMLVSRVLNDAGSDSDLLPLMQHALMRTWDRARQRAEESDQVTLTVRDYERVGGLSHALAGHLDEAYHAFVHDPEERRICQLMFRSLCHQGEDNRYTRRPVTLGEIAEIAGCTDEEVQSIADEFLQEGRNFLVLSEPGPTLDISHEALLRCWDRVRAWLHEEAESVTQLRHVSGAAKRWRAGEGSLWRPPELAIAWMWRQRWRPTRAWAQRYDTHFDQSMDFLNMSRVTWRRQRRMIYGALALTFCLLIGSAIYLRRQAQEERELKQEVQETLSRTDYHTAKYHLRDNQRILQPEADKALALLARSIIENPNNTATKAKISAMLLDQVYPRPVARWQHENRVRLLALSRDGKIAASHSWDHSILVWHPLQPEKGAQSFSIPSWPPALSFRSQPSELIAVTDHGLVHQWDLTSQRLKTVDLSKEAKPGVELPQKWVIASVLSPNDRDYFIGTSLGEVFVLNVETGKLSHRWDDETPITAMAISPDGLSLAVASGEHTLNVWNVGDLSQISLVRSVPGHSHVIQALAFHPSGERVISKDRSGLGLTSWVKDDRPTGKPNDFKKGGGVTGMAVSERFIFTSTLGSTIRPWSAFDGNEIGTRGLWTHHGVVNDVSVSANGHLVASGGADRVARLWSLQQPDGPRAAPMRHHESVRKVVLTPDGKRLITGSGDGHVTTWDITGTKDEPIQVSDIDGVHTILLPGDRFALWASTTGGLAGWDFEVGQEVVFPIVESAANPMHAWVIDKSGIIAVIGQSSGVVDLWDLDKRQQVGSWSMRGVPEFLSVSDDGEKIAVATGSAMRVFEAETGKQLGKTITTDSTITALALDRFRLYAGSEDGVLSVWTWRDGRRTASVSAVRQVAGEIQLQKLDRIRIRPDGRGILTASSHFQDFQVKLWRLERKALILERALDHKGNVSHSQWIQEGRKLVTTGDDDKLRVWDVHTGEQAVVPMHHDGGDVTVFAINKNETLALTGCVDGDVYLWDLASGELIRRLRGVGVASTLQICGPNDEVALIGTDKGAYLWSVPPMPEALSSAFLEFVQAVAGVRLEENFNVMPLAVETINRGYEGIRSLSDTDSMAHLTKWFLDKSEERPISPCLLVRRSK